MGKELNKALLNAQKVMTGAKKKGLNPHFKSQYATLEAVFEAIREPFSGNGLAVSQVMEVMGDGDRTVLVTKLLHVSGEELESRMILPDVRKPQDMGSAITYYRRYSLMSIAGLPAEDDDGNAAQSATTRGKEDMIGVEKAKKLRAALDSHPSVAEQVDKYLADNKIKLEQVANSVAREMWNSIAKDNEAYEG